MLCLSSPGLQQNVKEGGRIGYWALVGTKSSSTLA